MLATFTCRCIKRKVKGQALERRENSSSELPTFLEAWFKAWRIAAGREYWQVTPEAQILKPCPAFALSSGLDASKKHCLGQTVLLLTACNLQSLFSMAVLWIFSCLFFFFSVRIAGSHFEARVLKWSSFWCYALLFSQRGNFAVRCQHLVLSKGCWERWPL